MPWSENPKHEDTNFLTLTLLTVHLSIFTSIINQFDAQNFCFTVSLFHASTCFKHMCSSSGGQNCITQPLVSSHWNELSKITKIQFYKYEQILVKFYVWIFRVWLLCITYYKPVMSCRSCVYTVIKLVRKVLCLFTFMFA